MDIFRVNPSVSKGTLKTNISLYVLPGKLSSEITQKLKTISGNMFPVSKKNICTRSDLFSPQLFKKVPLLTKTLRVGRYNFDYISLMLLVDLECSKI